MVILSKQSKQHEDKVASAKLSVTIVAQDEERIIGKTLAAVRRLADEIIVLDSGSTDKTVEIAKSYGARVIHQPWLGYAAQKNAAIDLATGDWILSLDADEVLTPGLVAEIDSVINGKSSDGVDGFKIPRLLFIGDQPVKRGGFYPDAQLRLIRKNKGRFAPRVVHEAIRVDGKVVQLKNCMHHYSYTDVEHFARTMDHYAKLSADHYFSEGRVGWRASRLNEVVHPLWTFVYRQTVRGGLLEGQLGWRLNVIYADYVRKKITYLRQLVEQNPSKRG
jgi:glycosyltransferase involved in cell wall biosynthesis